MKVTGTFLPRGRVFELEFFGDTEDYFEPRMPSRRGLKSSIQRIIIENWAMFAEAIERGHDYCHNPSKPEMGKTGLVWGAVKRHLPRWVRGRKSMPLHFYVAIGNNSLDRRHGVDAFFWWEGVCATIDVSLIPKDRLGRLKADFVLTPKDLDVEELSILARKIAKLLKRRACIVRKLGLQKSKKKIYTFE